MQKAVEPRRSTSWEKLAHFMDKNFTTNIVLVCVFFSIKLTFLLTYKTFTAYFFVSWFLLFPKQLYRRLEGSAYLIVTIPKSKLLDFRGYMLNKKAFCFLMRLKDSLYCQ
jgi:hypothetical protein